MASAPVLVLGNKIDKAGAASEDEIRHWLGLHGQTTGKVSLWFYFCPPDNFYKNRYAIPHGFWSKTKPKYPSQQITKVFIFLHIFLVVKVAVSGLYVMAWEKIQVHFLRLEFTL